MARAVRNQGWEDAFALIAWTCPCEALHIIHTGLKRTPAEDEEQAAMWARLSDRVIDLLQPATLQ